MFWAEGAVWAQCVSGGLRNGEEAGVARVDELGKVGDLQASVWAPVLL